MQPGKLCNNLHYNDGPTKEGFSTLRPIVAMVSIVLETAAFMHGCLKLENGNGLRNGISHHYVKQ